MPDCFLSYAVQDKELATWVHDELCGHGVSVFMAGVTLKPGQNWSQEIMNNLKASSLVLFLASRAACASPYVQQELGGALASQKKVVPVVWGMPPTELPGWTKQFQAINLAGASIDTIRTQMTAVANTIKADKAKSLLVIGALVAGLLVLGSK